MGLGEAAGLNYINPRSFIGGMQGQAPEQEDIDPQELAPQQKPGDYLAHVEGLTGKYYDTYAQLKSYAHNMAKEYGIDVFAPDYSQPGGGEPFRTAQKLQAALQYTANDLANSRDIDKTMMELRAKNQIKFKKDFDPTQQASATMNPDDMFYSTQLEPGQQESNIRARENVYDQSSSNKLNAATYDRQVRQLDEAVKKGLLDPEVAAYQKQQLLKNTPQVAYQQLIQRGGSGKIPPGISVLKKVVNLSSGVWNDGTYKPVVKNSKTYLENTEMAGESVGQYATDEKGKTVYKPKIIKRWLKDPETGQVTIEYQDSSVPDDVVSNQPGATATNFIANNPKYGDVARTMDTAHSMGILDDTGSVIPQTLLPENAEDIKSKVRNSATHASAAVKARVNSVKAQLAEISDPFIGNNSVGFKLPDGREVEIAKHRGKDNKTYYVKNASELGYSSKDEKSLENLTAEQVTDLLSSFGKFDNEVSIPETAKKAQELIEKYRK